MCIHMFCDLDTVSEIIDSTESMEKWPVGGIDPIHNFLKLLRFHLRRNSLNSCTVV
jgi:hypothetical protein